MPSAGFGRRKRGDASHDQMMAVHVRLEGHIRKIEGLVGRYLRSPQDEATRQALVAELEKFDDKTARARRRLQQLQVGLGEVPSTEVLGDRGDL